MGKSEVLREYMRETKKRISDREKIDPEEVADKILSIWEIKELPVPVVEISRALGFKIYEQEYKEEDLSGFIAIDNKYQEIFGTDKLISINREDNQGHKRFTIAHEICHYIYDFDPRTMTSYSNPYITTRADDQMEKNANLFAANLLIPPNIFFEENRRLDEAGIALYEKIGILANLFQVSAKAIEKRFKELGIGE